LIILTAIGGFLMIGLLAMVTDVGWMYYQKNRLQTSVNAGWKAGYDELHRQLNSGSGVMSDDIRNRVSARVRDVFTLNGYTAGEAAAVTVQFSGVATFSGHLEVKAALPVSLFFARVMDYSWAMASADRGDNLIGTGTYDNGGGGEGIVPIGIPHGELEMGFDDQGKERFYYRPFTASEGFTIGREYLLRLGNPGKAATDGGGGGTGFVELLAGNSSHGSLDLGKKGGGANEYRDLFINGYKGMININDRLTLKTGQMEGPVDAARVERNDVRGERRVIIPIVDLPPESKTGNNSNCLTLYDLNGTNDPVRVIGFAVFRLLEPEETTRNAELGAWGMSGDGQLRGVFEQYVINPWEVPATALN
jgi:hypothetical protein